MHQSLLQGDYWWLYYLRPNVLLDAIAYGIITIWIAWLFVWLLHTSVL